MKTKITSIIILSFILIFLSLTTFGQTVTVGTGTGTTLYSPYSPSWPNYRTQYIYTKAMLDAAGLPAGAKINSLSFEVTAKGSTTPLENMTISIAHTATSTFGSTSFLNPTLTQVFFADYTNSVGWNAHPFSSDFTWNGTDNILIQVCWEGNTQESSTYDYIRRTLVTNSVNRAGTFGAGACTMATGTLDDDLPNIKFEYTNNATLTLTNVSETAGNTVAVPVNAADLAGLVGFQWTIEYDATKLTYVNCDNWDAGVTPTSVTINSSVPGKLMFVYNQDPNEINIANGTFFNINFDIDLAATGTACLSWSDNPTTRELSNHVPEIIDAVWENGCVTILPPPPTLIIDNSITGSIGNTVSLPINALSISGLVGFQWTIDYDETKLTYVNCTGWDSQVNGTVTVFDNGDKLMFTHSNGSTAADEIDIANGKFFDINFTVNAGATGDACLSWSDDPTVRELSDITPAVITGVTWTDGCITIVLEGYWTGDVSTEWDNTGNWTDAHIPVSGDNAVIPDVSAGSNRYPLIDISAVCANLQINNGANVQIAPDFSLTVETNLTNNSGVDGLIIKSDETGTGSLIHNTANVDGTVERFFEAPTGTQWHFLSSPVANAPRSMFTANNFYYYDESTRDFWASNTDYQGVYGWTNPTTAMETMNGYIYYYYQTTLNYTGKLNYNAAGYNLNTSYTTNSGAMTPTYPENGTGPYNSDWNAFDGWNLLGNPYPCAVDWDEVTLSANVQNTLYLYDDNTDNYKYYNNGGTLVTGTGTLGIALNGGSRFIPVGQGFFVKTDANAENVSIPLNARVHNTQDFLKNKNTKTQEQKFIRLETSLGNFSDELIVRTLPEATNDFDNQFDAYKRYSWNADMPQIYSMDIDKNTEYAINTLPEFDETISVPLGYNINAAGSYSIKLSENNFENVDVYIEDTYQNKNTLLHELENYNFDIQAGNSKDRFILHLIKNTNNVLDIDNNISVFPNPTTGEFTIHSSKGIIEKVEIVDITGKIISSQNFDNNNCNINITSCASGIYTLKINTINNIYYKKIILN